MGRTGLALLAWLVDGAKIVTTMLLGFVATPYLLMFLGAERLGAIRASQQWTGYLPKLHFGLDQALDVLILESANQRDAARTAAVSKTAFKMLTRQALFLILPVAVVMAWMMPVLVPVSAPLKTELRIGAFVGLLGLFGSPFWNFGSVLACLQLGYLVSSALLVQALVSTGLAVTLAWAGYEIPGQFVARVIGIVCFGMIVTYLAFRHMPGFWSAPAAEIDKRQLRKLRWPMTLTSVSSQMNYSTDYIVVGLVLNPVAVTTFSITQRLMDAMGGILTHHVGNVSWAGLSEVLARDGRKAFEARVLELMRLTLGLGVVGVGTLAAYNQQFVDLWVGKRYYGGDLLTILTAVQMVVVGIAALFTFVIDAQGDTRDRAAVSAPGAIVNIALSVVLAQWVGLWGVVLASVIAYLSTDAWVSPYVFCRRYGVSGRALITTALRATVVSVPWSFLVWMVAHRRTHTAGWLDLFVEVAIAGTAGLVYLAFVVMTRDDRHAWKARLSALASQYRRAA